MVYNFFVQGFLVFLTGDSLAQLWLVFGFTLLYGLGILKTRPYVSGLNNFRAYASVLLFAGIHCIIIAMNYSRDSLMPSERERYFGYTIIGMLCAIILVGFIPVINNIKEAICMLATKLKKKNQVETSSSKKIMPIELGSKKISATETVRSGKTRASFSRQGKAGAFLRKLGSSCDVIPDNSSAVSPLTVGQFRVISPMTRPEITSVNPPKDTSKLIFHRKLDSQDNFSKSKPVDSNNSIVKKTPRKSRKSIGGANMFA